MGWWPTSGTIFYISFGSYQVIVTEKSVHNWYLVYGTSSVQRDPPDFFFSSHCGILLKIRKVNISVFRSNIVRISFFSLLDYY